MATLESSLSGALVTAQSQVSVPTSVTGIVGEFGTGPRAVSALTRELIDRMPGAAKYDSVRRSVERWLKTEKGEGGTNARRPGAKYRETLDKIAVERIDRVVTSKILRDGVTVHWHGEMIVSNDFSEREISVTLTGDEARPFIDDMLARDLSGAADEFNSAFFHAYFNTQGSRRAQDNAAIGDTFSLEFAIGDNLSMGANVGHRV